MSNNSAPAHHDKKSVTELPYSLTSCGELPPDLNGALNLAVHTCMLVGGILHFARQEQMPLDPDNKQAIKVFIAQVEGIKSEYPYHSAIKTVTNELTLFSDPTARFGAANAHQAALAIEYQVMNCIDLAVRIHQRCFTNLAAGITAENIATSYPAVCKALTAKEWPDANAIATACQIEAVKAAAARARISAANVPRPVQRLTIDLSRFTATLDGTSFDVNSLVALRWVKVLASNPGVWMGPHEVELFDPELPKKTRFDRLKKQLPKQIQVLIDSESGRGSRIRL